MTDIPGSATDALRRAGELPPLPREHPLQDALDQLGTSGEGLALDASRDQAGHVGVTVEGTKHLGKSWTVSAAAQWAKGVGYAAIGKLRWTPRKTQP